MELNVVTKPTQLVRLCFKYQGHENATFEMMCCLDNEGCLAPPYMYGHFREQNVEHKMVTYPVIIVEDQAEGLQMRLCVEWGWNEVLKTHLMFVDRPVAIGQCMERHDTSYNGTEISCYEMVSITPIIGK